MKKYIQFIHKIRNRFNSTEDYYEFQRFQAQWILNNLAKKINFDLCGGIVIDLGSGSGGYTTELVEKCRFVCGFDLNIPEKISNRENINFFKGDATDLPFKNGSFDFVFCSSLIEHILNQEKVICEINRVLKNESFCYLSFPPFYSPVGGHQFKPFHLLGEKNSLMLSKLFKGIEAKDFATSYGDFGLFPTTIRHIKTIVKTSNFEIVNTHTRFLPINVAKIPLLREILTWHVEFLLQKRGD